MAEELYKFKSLKVYSSTEWLANNSKKYRLVFHANDIGFLYVECALHNKNFDKEDWQIDLKIKCFEITNGKNQICNIKVSRQVSRYDQIVHIREGWGNKNKGSFWKPGQYLWEVHIDKKKVGSQTIYVESNEYIKRIDSEQYMSIEEMEFYESSYNDTERKSNLVIFNAKQTRYVYVRLLCKNEMIKHEWRGEFFLKFFKGARELKGQINKLMVISPNEEEFEINAGWGSNVKGSWRKGKYVVEVIHLDRIIAQASFDISDHFEEGELEWSVGRMREINEESNVGPGINSKDAFRKLHDLVGLAHVKKQINEHASYIQFLKLRKSKGFKDNFSMQLHAAFLGNPGTGKTTVANLIGAIYKGIGMLKKGHVHVVDRVDLVGEYIGQTAPKVKNAIDQAKGGVLFIDEAYALARNNGDSKDFGREVIEILVKEMSDPKCDFMVIVAGYPKEMNYFLNSNPGLKSRFKHVYKFDDYSLEELLLMTDVASQNLGIQLTKAAKNKFREIITNLYRQKDQTFGNARVVFNLIEKAKVKMGLRLVSEKKTEYTKEELSTIKLRDVIAVERVYEKSVSILPIDEALLTESLKELDSLIGLQKIKDQVHELIDVVRFYHLRGKHIHKSFNLHSILIGNPGTGKTTMARILASIFKALGLLERGHLVEVDRHDLIAGYVGQSAIKTSEVIDKAMGGVLFIDEAYSLVQNSFNDFGNEVIQTLVKRMEDNRGEFYVFVAGYTDKMKGFLKSNPGIISRFDKTYEFDDFEVHELKNIAHYIIDQQGYIISSKASNSLGEHINSLYMKKDKFFGNARVIRKLVLDLIKVQNLRLSNLNDSDLSNYVIKSIVNEDVESVITSANELNLNRDSKIGFGLPSKA